MQNNVYSVYQVNNYIKNLVATDPFLENVSIRGEISNCKYHSSGHIYFTLKDEKSAISCVMFASAKATGLKFRLEEGMKVVVRGSLDVYVRDGKYQVYANKIEQEGIGNLYEQFELLKKKLEEMGMFSPMYKKPIPRFVRRLGVVTAPTGAAIRDIIDVSKRRNPGIQIILFPAIVQGEAAPASIIEGIKALDAYGVDTIIVGRGGGSMEDLWGFNDEGVAQAIFDCATPIISAVGHEIDFTIADYVSDLRAPTPSAAAELAAINVADYVNQLESAKTRLSRDFSRVVENKRLKLTGYQNRIKLMSPQTRLNENKHRLAMAEEKLISLMNSSLLDNRHRLELLAGKLHGLSPLNKLGGGYAYVEGTKGAIKRKVDIKPDDEIKVSLSDGSFKAKVTEIM